VKILVTGGNGFLGSWLVKKLTSEGHSVTVLHRTSSDLSSIRGLNYESASGDIGDLQSVLDAAIGVEAIFHVAGLVSYRPRDYSLMESVNVTGTQNVIDAALKSKARLVFTSSIVTVGASFKEEVLNEESPFTLHKYNLGYYETKLRAEKLIQKNVLEKGLNAVIVNPAVMFGAGDAVKSSRSVHLKVAQGKFPFYPSGGVNVLHVEDAVDGHIQALTKGRAGQRYILGGENIKTRDLFNLLAKYGGHPPPKLPLPDLFLKGSFSLFKGAAALGYKPKISSDNFLIATLFHWYDSSKAEEELGFTTRPAEEALSESVQWAKENGYFSSRALAR
jgi:dihydroflavonol-4-reductase